MGLFDKFRSKEDTPDPKSEASAASAELMSWTQQVFQQLEAQRLHIEPGENLNQAFARILTREEQTVNSEEKDVALQMLKRTALARLRKEFNLSSAGDETTGGSQPQAAGSVGKKDLQDHPAEATYEMVLGTSEELQEVPIAHLMGLAELWQRIVIAGSEGESTPETSLKEYQRIYLSLGPGENAELSAWFRGSSAMVRSFLEKLRELGLTSE